MSAAELSGDERRRLRLAIDAAVRERYGKRALPRCSGCRMPLDDLTPGCSTCWDRHRNRAYRYPKGRYVEESRQLFKVNRARFESWAIERWRQNQLAGQATRQRRAAA